MALIWTESFDGPLTSTKYVFWTISSVDTTAGRNGKGARSTDNSFRLFQTPDFSATDEDDVIIVGFAIKYRITPNATHDVCILGHSTGGTTQVKLRVTTTFVIQLTDGNNTVLAQTSAPMLSTGAWYYVEFKAKIHDTLGTVEVRTNGVTRASAINVDTKPSSPSTVNRAYFYVSQQSGSVTELMYLDDIYICNEQGASFNDFLGDVRIEGLTPNGDGNSSQWVGSDADSVNNYLLVNDANDATYVSSNTTGNKDTYAHTNLAGSTGTVLGVNQWIRAYTDVLPRQIIPVARLSGTEVDGTAKDLTASAAWYQNFSQTKPGGGTWALSDVDSAEFGYKVGT